MLEKVGLRPSLRGLHRIRFLKCGWRAYFLGLRPFGRRAGWRLEFRYLVHVALPTMRSSGNKLSQTGNAQKASKTCKPGQGAAIEAYESQPCSQSCL